MDYFQMCLIDIMVAKEWPGYLNYSFSTHTLQDHVDSTIIAMLTQTSSIAPFWRLQ